MINLRPGTDLTKVQALPMGEVGIKQPVTKSFGLYRIISSLFITPVTCQEMLTTFIAFVFLTCILNL